MSLIMKNKVFRTKIIIYIKRGEDQNIFYMLIQIHRTFMNLRGMKILKL